MLSYNRGYFVLLIIHHLKVKANVFSTFSVNCHVNLSCKYYDWIYACRGNYVNESEWKLGQVHIMLYKHLCCQFRLIALITSIPLWNWMRRYCPWLHLSFRCRSVTSESLALNCDLHHNQNDHNTKSMGC